MKRTIKTISFSMIFVLAFISVWNLPQKAIAKSDQYTYHGYLGFQTCAYAFRDTWDNPDYGLKSKEINYKTDVGYWSNWKLSKVSGSFEDASMKKNQTYKVTMKGIDLQKLQGDGPNDVPASRLLMLYVSTDIPLSMPDVKAENVTLKIDGKTVRQYKSIPCKKWADKYYQFMIADNYVSGNALHVLPSDEMEIMYTLSGVDFQKNYKEISIGDSLVQGDCKYKLVKAGKLKMMGLTKNGKRKEKLILPSKVKIKGISFEVIGIGSKAFQSASARYIELNKNIDKIPGKAFSGCNNLRILRLQSRLKKVSKKAFQGCGKVRITGKFNKINQSLI